MRCRPWPGPAGRTAAQNSLTNGGLIILVYRWKRPSVGVGKPRFIPKISESQWRLGYVSSLLKNLARRKLVSVASTENTVGSFFVLFGSAPGGERGQVVWEEH